jgi:dihydroorotase
MKNKKIQNLIVYSLAVFFILSVFYLFYSVQKPLESEWWAIYFENLENKKLNFIIENHSNKTEFNYEVWKDEKKILSQKTNCFKNDVCSIKIDNNEINGRFLIKVLSDKEKREIYKNL